MRVYQLWTVHHLYQERFHDNHPTSFRIPSENVSTYDLPHTKVHTCRLPIQDWWGGVRLGSLCLSCRRTTLVRLGPESLPRTLPVRRSRVVRRRPRNPVGMSLCNVLRGTSTVRSVGVTPPVSQLVTPCPCPRPRRTDRHTRTVGVGQVDTFPCPSEHTVVVLCTNEGKPDEDVVDHVCGLHTPTRLRAAQYRRPPFRPHSPWKRPVRQISTFSVPEVRDESTGNDPLET